jgi:hypothetical protein
VADDDAEAIARRLADELEAAPALTFQVSALDAYSIVAITQLAWRHPGLSKAHTAMIERFARGMQEAIRRHTPFAAETLERGWDRAFDVLREVDIDG